MKQIPQAPESPNIRVLAQQLRERFTNVTTSVTLTNPVLTAVDGSGLELVIVDNVPKDPALYTVSGRVITFDTPLAGTEVVVVHYPYRS